MDLIIAIFLAFFAAILVMAIIWPPLYHFGRKLKGTQPAESMDILSDNLEGINATSSGRVNGLSKTLKKANDHN